ncbi:MAG: Na-Ca exchanger/integrin-beta4, partial [Acidimicrobiaceae bacterium]
VPAVVNIAVVADAHEGVVSTLGHALVSRTDDDLSQALTVRYEVSGTATPGVDYRALFGSVEIAAGQVSAPIVIQPIDDLIPEFPESAIVALAADPAYQLGEASQATVNISNQETVTATAGTNLAFTIGYTALTTTELPVLTAEVLPVGASFSIVHSEAHPPGAHTFGQFSWTPLLEQVGSHEVVFRVTVPGTDIDETSSLIIDVVPPVVGPTIDLGGSTDFENDGQAQLFTWNVADANGLGPVNVNVTKDGSEIFASTDISGSFDFDADGPGSYALTATASNLLGETAQATRSVEVVDDDPAPPLIFLGGSFGSETENQTQFFTWAVSDDSGLSAFSVTVTRDLGNGPVTLFETTNLAQTTGSFNFDEFRAGTYQITVTARDADGDWPGDDLFAV